MQDAGTAGQDGAQGAAAPAITQYDCNIRWSDHLVELTLMAWDYSAKFQIKVGGNCRGFDVIDSAVSQLFDQLLPQGESDDGPASVTLVAEDGGTLLCEDDENRDEEWLKDMVVSAVIVSHTPRVHSRADTVKVSGKQQVGA